MRSTPRAWRTAALGAALLAGAVVALVSPPATSASTAAGSEPTSAAGACADTEGVTVVVDFGTLGGGTQTRCAPEPVSTGYDALDRAGYQVEGTQAFPGLLCRIDGKPADDPCQRAPKADYYWAYWTATAPAEPWTYSQEGAGTREPPPGSVEGWAFSDGCTRQPGASTTCSSATTTTPATTSASTTSQPPASAGATGTGSTSGTTAGVSGVTTTPEGSDAAGVTEATDEGLALPSPHDDDRDDDLARDGRRDAVARGPADSDRGSPAGVIAGLAIVGAFGLATARRQRQRRRATLAGSVGE